MFIELTKNISERERNIIGIFDLDSSTVSNVTRKFLSNAEKFGKTVGIGTLPKSFVLTDKDKIYFSSHLSRYMAKYGENMRG